MLDFISFTWPHEWMTGSVIYDVCDGNVANESSKGVMGKQSLHHILMSRWWLSIPFSSSCSGNHTMCLTWNCDWGGHNHPYGGKYQKQKRFPDILKKIIKTTTVQLFKYTVHSTDVGIYISKIVSSLSLENTSRNKGCDPRNVSFLKKIYY